MPPTPEDPLDEQGNDSDSQDDSLSTALEQDTDRELRDTGMRTDRGILQRWITIRDTPGGGERFLLGLLCILLALLVWHILTRGEGDDRIINAYALPSLKETAGSFKSLWFDRALMRGAFASLSRVLGGFLLAAAIAIPLGVIAGCFPRFHAFLRPLSIFGRNVPVAALIPIMIFWFGIGDLSKVMFIFFAAAAFIFFDTSMSIRMVPGNYLDTAYTLGARSSWKKGISKSLLFGAAYALISLLTFYLLAEKPVSVAEAAAAEDTSLALPIFERPGFWIKVGGSFVVGMLLWLPIQSHQAISKVLFPLALPNIINSLRLLFGLAFGYIILAEVINAEFGLGKIITMSQRQGPREHIYLVLIAIALLAFLIDRIIIWIQRMAFPYVKHGH